MLTATDLMRENVETVHADDEVGDVLERLTDAPFNGFPVVDDDRRVVGIVTQSDLVALFEPEDRTFWIPVGLPPFTETLSYAVDVSLDELDLGFDAVEAASTPVCDVMTTEVVTVDPDEDLDAVLDLLADDERDINRIPVVDDGVLVGIIARQDVLRTLRDERRARDA